MKKLFTGLGIVLVVMVTPVPPTQAQDPITLIIKAGIIKAIKAMDLQIQRLQNRTIWLQNAQKVLENTMSQAKLTEISDWVEKQRQLYSDYYQELREVKNIIAYYQRIRDITQQQVRLVAEYKRAWGLFKQDQHFSPEELEYMSNVYTGILAASSQNLDYILKVINAFSYQMSDAQRLAIINATADQLEINYRDLKAFNEQNMLLSLQRARSKQEVEVIKQLYGIQ
ncbi:conjugal transfer protein TraI [Adhaeribacter rhizoryzae]|uniref:Conjugal transfer protein TraI n=1 Tax=Adhaeribacter rhizoryzae TaxID=2607907 RepID=A0A5M6DKP3_9BACT|nr:conjugal transfer protein TraI [Adhaeribacter rhizoryzae]KAA5548117.1 conjugal transfer protein TraI [Adhaeribacter rhizoryzae]